MLPAGYFDPIITRVIIVATVNGQPNVVDGRRDHAPGDLAQATKSASPPSP